MDKQKNLTIIILSYNSSHIIKSCLNGFNFDKYEVLVVDNASKDNTVEIVKNNFPQVKILKLDKNFGYGGGNNIALKQVKTEFVLILNPDSIISENDIEIVLEEMKKNPTVANAGPVVLKQYPLQKEEYDAKLDHMAQDFKGIKDCYWEKIGGNYSVRFIVGAALFLRMSILQKIGFVDEKIFLYYEDDELCKRIRDNGYKSMIVPEAKAFHMGGGSSAEVSFRCIYKKSWHLSWSKFYWKKIQKGNFRAKKSSLKFALVYFVKAVFSMLTFNSEKAFANLGSASGAFSFFIGLGAFKKNGIAR